MPAIQYSAGFKNPTGRAPQEGQLSASAATTAHSGAEMLVPPT